MTMTGWETHRTFKIIDGENQKLYLSVDMERFDEVNDYLQDHGLVDYDGDVVFFTAGEHTLIDEMIEYLGL